MLPESWPLDCTDSFGYPPLETAREGVAMPWGGVRFGNVAAELYFEKDQFDLRGDVRKSDENICARTGKPPEIDPFALKILHKHSPYDVEWSDMTRASGLYVAMLHGPMKEAKELVEKGLSNSVPLDELRYSSFRMPLEGEKVALHEHGTLTIAVSYVHKTPVANGLLKANEFQISQLEDILESIRERPPDNTQRVRLWTDQALSKNLQGVTERPKWILYGLIPYTAFTIASLHSGDKSDSMSMWSACEQILADGGAGCLFSKRIPRPSFCKDHCYAFDTVKAAKSFGDALAVNSNLRRLSAAIHAGVLDEPVTYHIADAQMLLKLAYYMVRAGTTVSLAHAVDCDSCLNATGREHIGFARAVLASADVYDQKERLPDGLRERLNKTRMLWRYPKVRARQGYVSWHGMREFVPGAGRFAKLVPANDFERFVKHTFVTKLTRAGAVSDTESIAISAVPLGTQCGYNALLVKGRNLFDAPVFIDFSVRLNLRDLHGLHRAVQSGDMQGEVKMYFRHPEFDEALEELRFHSMIPISSLYWEAFGYSSPQSNVLNIKAFMTVAKLAGKLGA